MATVASGVSAYRTTASLPEAPAGAEPARWADGVAAFSLHADGAPGLSFSAVESTIRGAAAVWSEPECSSLELRYLGATMSSAVPGDTRNTIEWIPSGWTERGFPSDAAASTDVLYIVAPDGAWRVAEADVYLNAEAHSWVLEGDAPDARSIRSVMVHEFGHLLGLLHPCESGGSDGAPACDAGRFGGEAMYPAYSAGQDELSPDDIAGVCELYPAESCSETGCPDGSACTTSGCRPSCDDEVCSGSETCSSAGCQSVYLCPEWDGCLEGANCLSPSDCVSNLDCVGGVCVTGSAAPGDPCSTASECDSGICAAGGHCAKICVQDSDCGGPGDCVESGGHRICTGPATGFDESCATASECVSQVCLAVDGRSVCSRECGATWPSCPDGWVCGTADGASVCLPPEPPAACSLALMRARPARAGWVCTAALILLGLVARRRRYGNGLEFK